ncbi:MAG: radical SAM protein, partial [Bdellovibrio sp.]|nr:radical SAM protein [Bdellovibrio sp.]
LTCCNLRCTYCDTSYAFKNGQKMRISEIVAKIKSYNTPYVLITGGEPLLQRETTTLINTLLDGKYLVSLETHGEISLEKVNPKTKIIMDIKTPSSGMCRGAFVKNIPFLKSNDEIKFVIASQTDYFWAIQILQQHSFLTREIILSPATAEKDQPGTFPAVEPVWLANQILKDKLPVRFQLQLQKVLWGKNLQGI